MFNFGMPRELALLFKEFRLKNGVARDEELLRPVWKRNKGIRKFTCMFLGIARCALIWKIRVRHNVPKSSVTFRPLFLNVNCDERRQPGLRCLQVPELSIDAMYSYCAKGATGLTAWFPRGWCLFNSALDFSISNDRHV